MENQHLDKLIEKYILKTATVEEQQELLDWYNGHNDGEVMWSSDQLNEEVLVKRRLLANINERIQPKAKSISLWPRIAVAAAAVAAIVFGVYFFNYRSEIASVPRNDEVVKNDIAPGKKGATITLANGKVIQLSDAKSGVVIGKNDLKYDDNTLVIQSDSEGSRFLGTRNDKGGERSVALTASTAKGQTYQFTLPDGTKVWLNADSKLEFPSSFVNNKTRNVILSGEGYFEVAKDKTHPFVVETDQQTVEVLGTHFNINSYAEESSTKTTLLEGRVKINDATILKPNQQSVLTGSNSIKVQDVNAEEAIAWKNNEFSFNGDDLPAVMRQIARWYDVEVVYQGDVRSLGIISTISRTEKLSEILWALEMNHDVHFKIEGRRVLVMKQ